MLKYIFLTSSSYSGSTLLAFMMGAHPKIATVGEITGIIERINPNKYKCSCGKLLKDCDFWKSVFLHIKKLHKDFSYKNFKTRYNPKSKRFIDRLQFLNLRYNKISNIRDYIYQQIPKYYNYFKNITKRNIDLANIILHITNKNIFFDTAKNPNRIKFLKQNLNCEFKVIHLVRDGRGILNSIKRHHPNILNLRAIMSWKKTNKFAERALKYIEKENRYLLLYNDLVNNPKRELTKLCKFIDVKYSSKCLNFRNWNHHIIGNKMRLKSSNKIYNDEKWKLNLSPKQLRLFNIFGRKMNEKYQCY